MYLFSKDRPEVHSRMFIFCSGLSFYSTWSSTQKVAWQTLLAHCCCSSSALALSVLASTQHWHLFAHMGRGQKSEESATSSFGQELQTVATVTIAWFPPSWRSKYAEINFTESPAEYTSAQGLPEIPSLPWFIYLVDDLASNLCSESASERSHNKTGLGKEGSKTVQFLVSSYPPASTCIIFIPL